MIVMAGLPVNWLPLQNTLTISLRQSENDSMTSTEAERILHT
jgi:hypothetical protein